MINKKGSARFDPFTDLILDEYERKLEESIERGEWKSVQNKKKTKKMFEDAAKQYVQLQKSKKITLRINQKDLIRLKARAKRKNIPYQTLLNALVRDYVEGKYALTV